MGVLWAVWDCIELSSGRVGGRLGALFGVVLRRLAASWGRLAATLCRLGAVLGASC